MYTMDVSRRMNAPRSAIYRALLDPEAIAAWRVPDGMTGHVHEFDAREGGRFRISLVYDDPDAVGKTDDRTDTYHGHFERLVPDEQVVEVDEFESDDAELAGPIILTTTLADADGGGTDVTFRYEGLPDSISREDNETGTRMALENLARLVEKSGQVSVPQFVVGHVVRTTNEAEADEARASIPGLWERSTSDEALLSWPGRTGEELFAVYFDYESDAAGAYSLLVGVGATSLEGLPTALASVRPGAADREVFRVEGPMPAALASTWARIWSASADGSLDRSFSADVEVHRPDGSVAILIATS